MISIRSYLEKLAGEEGLRSAFLKLVQSLVKVMQEKMIKADAEEHNWLCANLDSLVQRLVEDVSPKNIEVVAALLTKTLEDHWLKLGLQLDNRQHEFKRIINLLTESAARLDGQNKHFYLSLREAVQNFQDISQMEDITYIRKKLTEQVTHLEETVQRQEGVSNETVGRLQSELEQAHKQIASLIEAVTTDSLTRLPARQAGEKALRDHIEKNEPFVLGMAVVERLELINLRYGVDSGDEVVRKFARQLRENMPERTFLCRWGGPAFLSIVPRMSAGELRVLLQKVLSEIAAEPMEIEAKGAGFIRITSRFAVHEWTPGQVAEKIVRLVDIFCFSPKGESGEADPRHFTKAAI